MNNYNFRIKNKFNFNLPQIKAVLPTLSFILISAFLSNNCLIIESLPLMEAKMNNFNSRIKNKLIKF
jgi:hypothetical protein